MSLLREVMSKLLGVWLLIVVAAHAQIIELPTWLAIPAAMTVMVVIGHMIWEHLFVPLKNKLAGRSNA